MAKWPGWFWWGRRVCVCAVMKCARTQHTPGPRTQPHAFARTAHTLVPRKGTPHAVYLSPGRVRHVEMLINYYIHNNCVITHRENDRCQRENEGERTTISLAAKRTSHAQFTHASKMHVRCVRWVFRACWFQPTTHQQQQNNTNLVAKIQLTHTHARERNSTFLSQAIRLNMCASMLVC